MYTAIVLDEPSRNSIIQKFSAVLPHQFQFSNGLPHHMTINLGNFSEALNSKEILGKQALLHCNELVYDVSMGVCALAVESALCDGQPVNCMNRCPHITVALIPPAKPRFSNDLLEKRPSSSKSFPCNLQLCGNVEVLEC